MMFGRSFVKVETLLIVLFLMFTDSIGHKGSSPAHVTNTNIALDKPASQSSPHPTKNLPARKAVDGSTRQSLCRCSHTGDDDQAWWAVDLLDAYNIGCLKIYSMKDQTLLSDFTIYVGKEVGNTTEYTPCFTYPEVLGTTGSYLPCVTTSRYRHIKIQLNALATPLSLCEVMVYSREDMPSECQSFSEIHTMSTADVFDVASNVDVFDVTTIEDVAPGVLTTVSELSTQPSEGHVPLIPSPDGTYMTDYSILRSSYSAVVTPNIDSTVSHVFNLANTLSTADDSMTLYPSYSSGNVLQTSDFSKSINGLFTTDDAFQSVFTLMVSHEAYVFDQSRLALEEWSTSGHVTMTTSSDWSTTSFAPLLNKSVSGGKELACLCGCSDKREKLLRLRLHHWRVSLTLKKTEMSLYRRSKECAVNIKSSCKYIGVFGLSIVVSLFSAVLVFDIMELGRNIFCFKFKRNLLNKRSGGKF